jgi:transcription initiation factor TFIIIB Brf1 subunit/transcription initiation factor TFIIB
MTTNNKLITVNDVNNVNDVNDVNNINDVNDILLQISISKKNKLKLEKQELNNVDVIDITCNDCKSRNLEEKDGFYICQKCGLYNDCIIDSGQEWRFYGADDNKGNNQSRCDLPTSELLPKTTIGALVGFSTRENKTSKRIRNMNNWNAIPYRESSLLESFNNITIMSQNSGINQCIIEEAKYMYKKVTDIKSSRRTKKEAMKAGCIMLACKLKGVPRNCNEIAQIFKLKNNKTFRKSIKTFEEIWNNIQLSENNITDKIKLNIALDKTNKTNNLVENESSGESSDESQNDSDDESDDDSDDDSDEELNKNESDRNEVYVNESERNKVNANDSSTSDSSDCDEIEFHRKQSYSKNIDTHSKKIDTKNIVNSNKILISLPNIVNKDNATNKNNTTNKDNATPKQSKNLEECITKLHRYSCVLGFDDKIFQACRLILIHIENEKYLDKHTPQSRTSAVIYYIIDRLGININKYQILQTCEVSDVTIIKCFHKLMKFKTELLKINIEF